MIPLLALGTVIAFGSLAVMFWTRAKKIQLAPPQPSRQTELDRRYDNWWANSSEEKDPPISTEGTRSGRISARAPNAANKPRSYRSRRSEDSGDDVLLGATAALYAMSSDDDCCGCDDWHD